jgi:folylpolyglutamate synthase/dihydropteroate synthase
LDCANVLDAAVVVLTHLSLDHCQFLGPTVAHIAREKLALCRADRPLIVAPQSATGAAAVATARETIIPATTSVDLIS